MLQVTIYRLDEGGNTSRDIDLAILKALLKGMIIVYVLRIVNNSGYRLHKLLTVSISA